MIIDGLGILASHTMPNMLPYFVAQTLFFGAVPVLIGSMWGARVGKAPFAWRRIGGFVLGATFGSVTVVVASLAFGIWLASLSLTGDLPLMAMAISAGVLTGSMLAYFTARLGRPKERPVTLAELDDVCALIERIISAGTRMREAPESGAVLPHGSDCSAEWPAVINDQWETLRKKQLRFHHAPTLLHEEIKPCLAEAKSLLDEIHRYQHR